MRRAEKTTTQAEAHDGPPMPKSKQNTMALSVCDRRCWTTLPSTSGSLALDFIILPLSRAPPSHTCPPRLHSNPHPSSTLPRPRHLDAPNCANSRPFVPSFPPRLPRPARRYRSLGHPRYRTGGSHSRSKERKCPVDEVSRVLSNQRVHYNSLTRVASVIRACTRI